MTQTVTRAMPDGRPAPAPAAIPSLAARYAAIRDATERLAAPLSAEDQTVQSMPDASPAKWHRAHTAWFFETFLLRPHAPGYRPFDERFAVLFNSYYVGAGPRHARPRRGMITRPSAEEVGAYRAHVDAAMARLLEPPVAPELAALVELGLQHEQQHQELLLTDALHLLAQNPLKPALDPAWREPAAPPGPTRFLDGPDGLVALGLDPATATGFWFDNETPRHRAWLEPWRIADRPVTNAEWMEFMRDGGYRNPALWMSEGFALAEAEGWEAPMYWEGGPGDWRVFTPAGLHEPEPEAPVRHVSWYEADAFARWDSRRLPTEQEWEAAAEALPELRAATGHVWQWTGSAYRPYPGFRPWPGTVGEYNGKFMVGQMVLRGGSSATPEGHARPSYRNFFPPGVRWQFSGLRLAEDAS